MEYNNIRFKRCTPETINTFRQNKPSLIVDDICYLYPNVERSVVYEILLRRGVFKWFAARRDLIRLKENLKNQIKRLNGKKTLEQKGEWKTLVKCRESLRKIFHSNRWRCQDDDRKTRDYLKNFTLDYFADKFDIDSKKQLRRLMNIIHTGIDGL